MKRTIVFYTLYDRFWHWVQAISATLLLWTGFEISYPSVFSGLGFATAVTVHNIAGLILIINAFLALFYNFASGLLRRYVPGIDDFMTLGIRHAHYYIWGIFKGESHPFDKTPEKRLLPLQKITYFGVLNVLLPLMIVTGAIKLSATYLPDIVEMFGGLRVLGPIHRFGAWLFLAFLLVHVYMITTGHTLLSNLKTMLTGSETVIDQPEENA